METAFPRPISITFDRVDMPYKQGLTRLEHFRKQLFIKDIYFLAHPMRQIRLL
jgi:hypothetical protein